MSGDLDLADGCLAGRRIGVTAERRVDQQARFIEARGGTIVRAPVLRTRAPDSELLVGVAMRMVEQPPSVLIVQTGQGLRWWLDAIGDTVAGELADSLASTEVWSRGAKATSACRSHGIEPRWQAADETTAEIVDRMRRAELRGRCVGILADGGDTLARDATTTARLTDAVEAAGGTPFVVDVYRYEMPDPVDDAVALVREIVAERIDAVTFTSSPAIRHLRSIAQSASLLEPLDAAFRGSCRPVVVGPVCADTARAAGWGDIVEPAVARLMPMLNEMTAVLQANESGV